MFQAINAQTLIHNLIFMFGQNLEKTKEIFLIRKVTRELKFNAFLLDYTNNN